MNKKATSTKWSGNKPNEALRWVGDLLEWSQIPYFLIGDTLKQVMDGQTLEVEKIEIGVKARNLTQDTKKLLKTFAPWVEFGDIINLEFEGVPIEIKLIKRNYEFFKNPDIAYYNYDEYKIPNPWERYLKARWIVK